MSSAEDSSAADAALVLDFLNTVDFDLHTDVLDDPAGWQGWLATRALADDQHARATRDGIRAAIGCRAAPPAPPATVHIQLVAGIPTLVACTATGAVLAAATRLAVLGEWDRVKICPADDCRWAFFDRSRNRSRTWCSMRVCGNREKARTWRERAKLA
ncbi:CGNR zinc finger domain-containing protein [Actinokineospora cianjurensis]|uniref:Putative stress-induced transcription regulator n=1 Tax=Actinokineospora cianjurensis TaxID=585224 RepID=A0A421B8F4_9PSEU|nr:CGNR zinc finger domain-containing protein [Actinokineospora cianjurensis]RLK60599.1 putative stress-induced transcription regulator [Actinokineospora cianjurensis]